MSQFGTLLRRLGLRGRLLLAFASIAAFSVIAAVAAIYVFAEISTALDQISRKRMPTALASLELSREAERVVTAAPALLAVTRRAQYEEVSNEIGARVERLQTLLGRLRRGGLAPDMLTAIAPRIEGLIQNLSALDTLVSRRVSLSEQRRGGFRRLASANRNAKRLVGLGIVVMKSKVTQWRQETKAHPPGAPERDQSTRTFAEDLTRFLPQQEAQFEISTINDNLAKVAVAQSDTELSLLGFPLRRSIQNLEALVENLDPRLQRPLRDSIDEFHTLIEGPKSILQVRSDELEIIGQAERLIAENNALSRQLTEAVDRLVAGAGRDVERANQDVLAVQRGGSGVLIGTALLSLVCSGLIVWLYIQRNLLRRLTALSSSMLAVAGGNLRVALPTPRQRDEIDEMARALTVFRDTAVEIEDKGLREVDQARQRLVDAIESTSEGFALYDASDRLVLCNTIYKRMLYGAGDVEIAPGTPFETVLRRAVENKLIGEAIDDPEGYIRARLAQHRAPGQLVLQRRSDGRWILISERRVSSGGIVAVYSDITDLKRTEQELVAAKEQAEAANRAKSEFLANMSHELRTPMNAIIGFTRLVMRRGKEALPERQVANLEKILSSANHLLSLINNILDLSKIEARQLEVQSATFSLVPLIDQCLRTVEPMLTWCASCSRTRAIRSMRRRTGSRRCGRWRNAGRMPSCSIC